MVSQDPMTALNPVKTIGDQLRRDHPPAHQRLQSRGDARAIDMMKRVGIPSPGERLKSYPHQFSGGMLQRISIAMALSCNPKLLIADEPTTALDVTIQAQILELLQSLRNEFGMAVLLITHNLGVVADLATAWRSCMPARSLRIGRLKASFALPGIRTPMACSAFLRVLIRISIACRRSTAGCQACSASRRAVASIHAARTPSSAARPRFRASCRCRMEAASPVTSTMAISNAPSAM